MASTSTPSIWTQTGKRIASGLSKVLPHEEAYRFQLAFQSVYLPHLPESFESFRIVQLSDIHFYEFSSAQYHQTVVDTVNNLSPDIIVATGDIIHYGQDYLGDGNFYLKQMKARVAKLACMGNHDYSDDFRGFAVREMLSDSGFEVLLNEATVIEKEGQHLWISGIDDCMMSTPDPETAYNKVEKNAVHLSLLHNPSFAPVLARQPKAPDMILSGHTHGGQIRHLLVNWLQQLVFHQPYQYGWFNLNQSRLYVTSGIGSASIAIHLPSFDFALYPFRINTTPEIAVFDLTCQT
jgi:uncharacterized protein